jgi:hypothetical protein
MRRIVTKEQKEKAARQNKTSKRVDNKETKEVVEK